MRCAEQTSLGDDPATAVLEACLASRCEQPCALGCGADLLEALPPDAAAACQTCVAAQDVRR